MRTRSHRRLTSVGITKRRLNAFVMAGSQISAEAAITWLLQSNWPAKCLRDDCRVTQIKKPSLDMPA